MSSSIGKGSALSCNLREPGLSIILQPWSQDRLPRASQLNQSADDVVLRSALGFISRGRLPTAVKLPFLHPAPTPSSNSTQGELQYLLFLLFESIPCISWRPYFKSGDMLHPHPSSYAAVSKPHAS